MHEGRAVSDSNLIAKLRARLTPHTIHLLIKYGATGLSAVITDYGTFAFLYGVAKVPLIVATISSLSAGFIVSFILNRMWVFEAHKGNAHNSARLQIALYMVLFAFNTAFTYLFIRYTGKLGFNPYLAKLCSIGIIMLWNFVVYKKIIFRVVLAA
jgi:putative flippase GtrA